MHILYVNSTSTAMYNWQIYWRGEYAAACRWDLCALHYIENNGMHSYCYKWIFEGNKWHNIKCANVSGITAYLYQQRDYASDEWDLFIWWHFLFFISTSIIIYTLNLLLCVLKSFYLIYVKYRAIIKYFFSIYCC